jgi:hypothetical protein
VLRHSICDALASDLIQNCGFEQGTVGSYPTSWTANAGFTLEVGDFNQVVNGSENSGNYALQFGNDDNQPAAGISQTFSDINGDNYQVTFYTFDNGANEDSNAFLEALVDSNVEVKLTGAPGPGAGIANATYTEYQFDFTGTGSDTLSFLADTNPAEWYLDDVSVVGTSLSATPEPGSLALLVAGLMMVGVIGATRKTWFNSAVSLPTVVHVVRDLC